MDDYGNEFGSKHQVDNNTNIETRLQKKLIQNTTHGVWLGCKYIRIKYTNTGTYS